MGQGARATKSSMQHLVRSKRAYLKVPYLLEMKGKGGFSEPPFASKKVLHGILRGLPHFAPLLVSL